MIILNLNGHSNDLIASNWKACFARNTHWLHLFFNAIRNKQYIWMLCYDKSKSRQKVYNMAKFWCNLQTRDCKNQWIANWIARVSRRNKIDSSSRTRRECCTVWISVTLYRTRWRFASIQRHRKSILCFLAINFLLLSSFPVLWPTWPESHLKIDYSLRPKIWICLQWRNSLRDLQLNSRWPESRVVWANSTYFNLPVDSKCGHLSSVHTGCTR